MQPDPSGLTIPVILSLVFVAIIGHVMAVIWYTAVTRNWKISERVIYDLPIKKEQLRRELKNSMHTPLHAVILLICIGFGLFEDRSVVSFAQTVVIVFVWAEIWHYFSHRAFHLKSLHWIHVEHHRSHLNTPFTAVSFSLSEKIVFDLGIIIPIAIIDSYFVSLNYFGVAAWFGGYLIINSFSHANYEFRPQNYNSFIGRILTSTTYHSLHHSRYTGNYGLGTRFLDRMFGTEWTDYENVYRQVTAERKPLSKLRERLDAG